MKLTHILGDLEEEELRRLALRIVPNAADLLPYQLTNGVHSVLVNSGHVHQTVVSRHPPVLAVLLALLWSNDHRMELASMQDRIVNVTTALCERVTAGKILGRDDGCRIYRRLLLAAWDNDHVLDASETNLLRLLRAELGMSQVEHFLIAHHADIQPYWRPFQAFELVVQQLRDNGVVFLIDQHLVLPAELVRPVRLALGVELPLDAMRRLFENLNSEDLKAALDAQSMKTSGSKDARVRRLVMNMVQPSVVLQSAGLSDLKKLAKRVGAVTSGAKGELIVRLINHFREALDLEPEEDPEEPVIAEERELDRPAFAALFRCMTQHQLRRILEKLDLAVSGTKEVKIETLAKSHFCERTMLNVLKTSDLEQALKRAGTQHRGSKMHRIDSLIEHHRSWTSSG